MKLLEKLVSVYAPFSCLVCDAEGQPICAGCWPDLLEERPSTCYVCNRLTSESRVCSSCRSKSRLTHVWVAASYDGVIEELIKGLKYHHRRAYARTLARVLDTTLPYLDDVVLCAVPTTTVRKRRRGYDQSVEIARELSRLRKWPVQHALMRLDQSHQVGANRAQRLKNPIKYRVTGDVSGKTILLVDDVITTGSSVEAAAKALREAGAAHVNAVAVASNQRS